MAIQPKTLSPILPLRSVPEVSKIQQINPVQAIEPVYGIKSISAKKQTYNRNKEQIKTFLSNYNDPTELNSYIDALTNREAVAKRFGETWGAVSTTAGNASLIIDVVSTVLSVIAWIVSAILPDAGAIGAAGTAGATAVKAGATAGKAVATAGKVASKAAKFGKGVLKFAKNAINPFKGFKTAGVKTATKIAADAANYSTKAVKHANTVLKIAKARKALTAASWALKVPAIPAAVDVTIEKGFKPLFAGKPDEALLNTLMNLGETMDRFTNPIKGLILEGPEGFAKGAGWSDEGRTNYDYDTGFFLADMALEIITDPMNLLQMSDAIVKKAAIKNVAEPVARTLVDNTTAIMRTQFTDTFKEVTTENTEHIFKKVSSATKDVTARWADAVSDGFEKEATKLAKRKNKIFALLSKEEQAPFIQAAQTKLQKEGRQSIQRAFVRAIREQYPDATAEQIGLLLKRTGKETAENAAFESAFDSIQNITFDTLSSQVIRSTADFTQITDAAERAWTKRAMLTSGFGAGVEAIKAGFTGIQFWKNNLTKAKLMKAGAIKPVTGLDIKEYRKGKKLWEATYKYVYEISGETSTQDNLAFKVFVNTQFNRDKQIVSLIMQGNASPLKKAGQLEGQINTLYGCSFKDYVGYIKGINDLENDAFKEYVNYLEHTLQTLGNQTVREGLGETIKTADSLFKIKDIVPDNIVIQFQEAAKTTKDPIALAEKLYTIKMNDAYVNSLLINDPYISRILTNISSDEQIGALLNKIIGDANTLQPEISAQIPIAVRTIKEAGSAFMNIKALYTEVAGTAFPEIKGITDDAFKRYIIDQIFGLKDKTVVELLAGFDSITLPSLKNGLEVLLADKGFKFRDYPVLEDQIAGIYKRFLEAQQQAHITNVSGVIVEDFTKSIDDLIAYMPQFASELQELAVVNTQIKTVLAQIKNNNFQLLENILTTKNTIFNVLNSRELIDAGLALKTVAVKQNLDLFNLPAEASGNLVNAANYLGKSINDLVKSLEQYQVVFTKETRDAISYAYTAFRKEFLNNPAYAEKLQQPVFKYLRKTSNALEQFAHLVEFNKMPKDAVDSKIFLNILKDYLPTDVYLNVLNPSNLLVTDFAWDAMAQSDWIAKTAFNETILNTITAYHNFDLSVQKGFADFNEIRQALSKNKLDRVKMFQQERYVKALSRWASFYNDFKTFHDSLFDRTFAEEQLRAVREVLINNPVLNKKYAPLIDKLEKYWNGELKLKQSYKSTQTAAAAEYRKIIIDAEWTIQDIQQTAIDSDLNALAQQRLQNARVTLETAQQRLKELQAEGFDDEVTPFWWQLKEFNKEYVHAQHLINRKDIKTLTLWDPVKKQQEFNRLISKATDMNAQGALYNLFNKSPEEFINELAYRMRFITFSETDVENPKLKAMFNKFNTALKPLSDKVHFVHDVQNHRYWYVLDSKQTLSMTGRQLYLNNTPITRLQNAHSFDEFKLVDEFIGESDLKVTEVLNKFDEDLYELTGTHLGDSQGELLSKEILEDLYVQMPEEVQKLLPKLEDWTNKQFFEAYRFNESVLGSAASKRALGLYSTNQIINTRNALQEAIGQLKPKNEYVNAVFDSMSSIASPNSIYANFTDEELLEGLILNPEYHLVTLVEDKKYGFKTREILPTSVEEIKKAKELGAVIIPTQVYKDMYNVVNHRLGSSGFAKLWSRIMYVYKFGFLVNPAAWIRNRIDTTLKTRLELGPDYKEYKKQANDILKDVNALKKHIKDNKKIALKRAETEYGDLAFRLFEEKDRLEKFIQRRSKDGIIQEDQIKAWFADPTIKKRILTYDMYKELNSDFLSQGISGNVMKDLYAGSGGDLWNTFTQLTGNIIEFGNKFENNQRLATYLYELDQGLDYSSALSKISKIHFDYSFKTKAEQLAEMVFPFTTFSLRNYSYWVEMLEKHPWIMRNYVHLMKPSWDFKDYTPEELARNRQVQAQILYGQIKLGEFNDKVITFKANPSIQDAIQMFSDPINNIYDKLATPLATARDAALGKDVNLINAIPVVGPLTQTVQKSIETGSPLHTMIGVQSAPKRTGATRANGKWSNPNLTGTDKYTDSTYRTPKYRKNVIYDSYAVKGIKRYRLNLYPVIDIAHTIKSRYSVNVYNKIKNRVQKDVYKGIRYRLKLDVNRLR